MIAEEIPIEVPTKMQISCPISAPMTMSFREGLMKRLKLAAAPGQKLLLKELLAG